MAVSQLTWKVTTCEMPRLLIERQLRDGARGDGQLVLADGLRLLELLGRGLPGARALRRRCVYRR